VVVHLQQRIQKPDPALRERTDWKYSLLIALLCVVGVRLFLTVLLAGVATYLPRPELRERYATTRVEMIDTGWEGLLLGVWQREDALWYQKIATVGYSTDDMTPQLFPLFPLAMRVVSEATALHPIAAGILVSEISLLVALFLLHRLLLPRYGVGAANRTLVYIALFLRRSFCTDRSARASRFFSPFWPSISSREVDG
jgi:Gpi18-like mannosyltransferase